MKRSELVELVKELLDEANTTNSGGATMNPGKGIAYGIPKFLGKGTRAKKTLTNLGWKQQDRPERPTHTKAFDYL